MCFMALHYFPNDSWYCKKIFFFSVSCDRYHIGLRYACLWGFPGGTVVKNLLPMHKDVGSVPEMGRSPGEGNDNLLQYSCLENPMDRGTWRAILPGVSKSQIRLTGTRHMLVFVMLFQIDFNLIYLLMYMILSLFLKAG